MYESRPEVCNIERMYSRFAEGMTMDEYYSMMRAACVYLKKHSGDLHGGATGSQALDELLGRIPKSSLAQLADEITDKARR